MSRAALDASDYVFDEDELPGWTPSFLRAVLLDLTYWEFHAMELGLVGLLAGAGVRLGFVVEVGFFTAVFVGIAFGFRRIPPDSVPRFEGDGFVRAVLAVVSRISENIAARTVGREPWYFLLVYVVLTVLSWLSFPVLA